MGQLLPLEDFKNENEKLGLKAFTEKFQEPFLLISAKGKPTSLFPLPDRDIKKRISLGSADDCDIKLNGKGVDKKHLEIYHHNFLSWCFEDKKSKSGTSLDDEEIVPYMGYSITEDSDIKLGDVSIKMLEPERMAEAIFPQNKGKPRPSGGQVKRSGTERLSAARVQIPEPPQEEQDRTKELLKRLTCDRGSPLTTLVIEAKMLGREAFLDRYPDPILILRRIIMDKTKDPIYNFDSVPLSLRLFWPLSAEDGAQIALGRTDNCDIQLHAKVISKIHSEISFKDEAWWIKDMESVNGTFVDGRAIPSTAAQRLPTKAKISVSPHISLLFVQSTALANLLESFSSDRVS